MFIPTQVCDTVGLDPATTPVDACMHEVIADVREDGVSAPVASDVDGLQKVVADAKAKAVDLKIVVVPENPLRRHPAARHRHRGWARLPGFDGVGHQPDVRRYLQSGSSTA